MKQEPVNENNKTDGRASPDRLPYETPKLTEIEMVAFDVLSVTCGGKVSAFDAELQCFS
jgi:hypothetical protein